MKITHTFSALSSAALAAIFVSTPALANDPGNTLLREALATTDDVSAGDAFAGGRTWFKSRLRMETVEQDGFAEDAQALTLRTVLGYESGTWNDMSATVEFEDVSGFWLEDYNSTTNGNAGFPVVADPTGAEVNQSFLSYSGIADTAVKFGRQRITLGGHRFVGNVGWRQNEQTFEGLTLSTTKFAGAELFYAYIQNVSRIFGSASAAGNHRMESHLLNAVHQLGAIGKLTAYAYLLDYTKSAQFGMSSNTIGARFEGSRTLNDIDFGYAVEIANQNEAGDNPTERDADYLLLEASAKAKGFTFKVGDELLGGSGAAGDSFQTPLATLHKFNGWADQFLATPAAGLEDFYFSVGTTVSDVKLAAVYHEFSSDTGGTDYGTELDFVATYPVAKNVTAGLKYADFTADDAGGYSDVTKTWLWLGYSF
ncbi:MAG: alginate export family protein [Planctomycetota bacterium]|nr:hypothetical protein [Planctomycetota bacterium]MDP6838272.1 alginate export family protein [Planctomycetota bacterium]